MPIKSKSIFDSKIIFLLIFFLFSFGSVVYAQQSIKSAPFTTRVGNPTGPAPGTNIPGSPIADASCPIPGGKIGCASYGKPESWGGFNGSCRIDSTGNGGHCNQNYIKDVGICQVLTQNGNLIRTAKSIDVAASGTKAEDPVYLPSINGEAIRWRHVNITDAGFGFGWIKVFQSVGASQGVWTLHLIHVNRVGPVGLNEDAESGKAGATIYDLKGWKHVHISIGLNLQEPVIANNLQLYDPNWKFPDRELGMCTK